MELVDAYYQETSSIINLVISKPKEPCPDFKEEEQLWDLFMTNPRLNNYSWPIPDRLHPNMRAVNLERSDKMVRLDVEN